MLMGATLYAASMAGPQSALAQQSGGINWQTNPQQAANQAAVENKLVLLHFTADWCAPCQSQKRFVFSNPTVARAVNQSVIPVLVDIDLNRNLAAELGVKTIPFDVFLTSAGEVVTKRRSPTDAQNFIGMVTKIRAPGPAPLSGAMAKLDQLKRKLDPMSLPRDERATFGAEGPGNATVGVSKEAMELAAKSNYGNLMPFQNLGRKKNSQSGINSDLQSIVNALGTNTQQAAPASTSSDQFFSIPAERERQANTSSIPRANNLGAAPTASQPMSPQRSHEMLERQAFLARERANIEIPQQPASVKPVRVLNENFLAMQSNFGASSLKKSDRLPGLEVSEMIDSRTGQAVAPQVTGRSIARFKVDQPAAEPSNEVRIVPRRENRIAGHATDSSFATQATLKRETPPQATRQTSSPTAELSEASVVETETADFCLNGKCPVALALESKWVDGDARWGIVHRDRTYLFSSEENYRIFRANPDQYSPILAAYDPVEFHDSGDFVDGREENGVFMEKDEHQQIVLFSSAENREKFQNNPQLYMRSVRKALYTASRNDEANNAIELR